VFMFPSEASSDAAVEFDVQNVSFCATAPTVVSGTLRPCISLLLCPFPGTVGIVGYLYISDILRVARMAWSCGWKGIFRKRRPCFCLRHLDFSQCLHQRDTKCVTVMNNPWWFDEERWWQMFSQSGTIEQLFLRLTGVGVWWNGARSGVTGTTERHKELRRIFGPKRDEVIGSWRKLQNEELHNLYSH
jgi:hypothetical protein